MKEFWCLLLCGLGGSTVDFFWRLWSPPLMLNDLWHLGWIWLWTALLLAPVIGLWLYVKARYELRW